MQDEGDAGLGEQNRIMAVLEEDAELAQHVEQVRLHGPWLWAVTADRHHLACVLSFRRRFLERNFA